MVLFVIFDLTSVIYLNAKDARKHEQNKKTRYKNLLQPVIWRKFQLQKMFVKSQIEFLF